MISGIFRHAEQFFRFYRDRLFLDCLIRASAAEEEGLSAQITRWFHRGHEIRGVLKGEYSMKGNWVKFCTPGHFGDGKHMIEYSGVLQNDRLVLDSIDHNNGHRAKSIEYVRIPWEQPHRNQESA
jgi:hypothetical protein